MSHSAHHLRHAGLTLGWEMPVPQEVLFGAGVVLIIAGLILRWRLGHHWMSTEERLKEGLLSEDQARWRMAVARWSGPAVVVLGMVVFAIVFAR